MSDFNKILVITNTTKQCKKTVHCGISLAKQYKAELYVMHILHDVFNLDHWSIALPSLQNIQKEYMDMTNQAKEELGALIRMEQVTGLNIQVGFITKDPEEEIVNIVNEKNIDLIIMSEHSESGFEQYLFGRLNEKIHRKLPCSVLFIKNEPVFIKHQELCLKDDKIESCK